jgi:hypothetical protein
VPIISIRSVQILALAVAILSPFALAISAPAGEIEYPQIIQTRYEAADQKTGGQLVIWSEREKIFYGLDAKFSPSATWSSLR